jgi:hypothetical protein
LEGLDWQLVLVLWERKRKRKPGRLWRETLLFGFYKKQGAVALQGLLVFVGNERDTIVLILSAVLLLYQQVAMDSIDGNYFGGNRSVARGVIYHGGFFFSSNIDP